MKKIWIVLSIWIVAITTIHASVRDTLIVDRMTPLVGSGCVIDQIEKNLVDVIANTSDLDYIVDTNPNNYASFGSVAGVTLLYNPILSVKDMNHIYSETTPSAGFVIQSVQEGNNLLTADVLEMFWIETYLDGVKQEASKASSTSSTTSLLDLNLITVSNDGKTKIAIPTSKAFDEIRIGVAGINADVLSNLKLYYAFAGENKIEPITRTEYYPAASVHASSVTGIGNEWTTAIWNWPTAKNNLIGANSENEGVGFGALSDLLSEPRVTINAGKVIPAGTEVGFVIESGSVLAINILQNTVLTTFDDKDNEVESKTIVSVLGLAALGGGKTSVSMITTKPCQQVKIKFGGLNINIGGTKLFYAYTRDTRLDIRNNCDLKISSDVVLCSGTSVQLTGSTGVTWSMESQPAGGTATVNAAGLVENINLSGEYVVKATKGDCSDFIIISNKPTPQISYECNRPIVGDNIAPFSPKGGGCLLCLANETSGDLNNITDKDLLNYIEYTQGLDLASNTSIVGIQNTTPHEYYEASEESPRRVGFVMQATNQFLNLDLLKFFVIKTYKDGIEQESSLVNENNAIGADLIGGMDNQVRFSFVAKKEFNQVALWTAGLLNLNISKFRIYYAFEEPIIDDCLTGNTSNTCISLLSSNNYGAQLAYNHTGFGGIANVGAFINNLGNVIDDNVESYALVNKVAGIGGSATLSVKSNRIFGSGYQVGFIIEDQTWLTNVDLLSLVKMHTYLNGVATGDEFGTPAVLSLNLIGGGDKAYLAVTATQPFDEIQLNLSGLADVAVNTKVYGAYVRKDTDGDGIPDCVDKNPCGAELIPEVISSCLSDSAFVKIEGGRYGSTYKLYDGDTFVADFLDGVAGFIPEASGRYNYTIRENDIEIYNNISVIIHDTLTQWTGAVSNDWNDWDNWNNGSPISCTNVIIPSSAKLAETTNGPLYPILQDSIIYECNNIHFEPGGQVVGTNNLTYAKAWVELEATTQRRTFNSTPLKTTYVGDFFIGNMEDENDNTVYPYDNRPYFTNLFGGVRRINPRASVYFWTNGVWSVPSSESDRGKIAVPSTYSLQLTKGSLFEDTTKYVFRFAKEDTVYNKFTQTGVIQEGTFHVIREFPGRFIYEGENGLPLTEYIVNMNSSNGVFAIGNPYMCHLNIAKFLEANSDVVKPFIKRYNGDERNPNILYNDYLETVQGSNTSAAIAPMEGFFVESKNGETALAVKFTFDMMTDRDYTSTKTTSQPRSPIRDANGSQLPVSTLKAYTRSGEGIIESADKVSKLQVFTIAGKLILEKQNVTAPVKIPLTDGVNIIKVQTENETKTFKLIK